MRIFVPNYWGVMFPVCGQVLVKTMEVVYILFPLGGALKYAISIYVLQEISDRLSLGNFSGNFSGFSLL